MKCKAIKQHVSSEEVSLNFYERFILAFTSISILAFPNMVDLDCGEIIIY